MAWDKASAGRTVAAAVGLFLLAILLARLLLSRGELWVWFVLALPLLLIGLGVTVGFVRGVVLVAFFAATVLGIRWVLQVPQVGWVVLALTPALLLSVVVAVKAVRRAWPRQAQESRQESVEKS